MITLATLPMATEQQVFEQVVSHLLTQNKKSKNLIESQNASAYSSMYRNSEGLSCAAGCLISDDEYSHGRMEYNNWGNLVRRKIVPEEHFALISKLQLIHDSSNFKVEDWKEAFIRVAEVHGFNTEFINKL